MKTKLIVTVMMIFGILLTGFTTKTETQESKTDLINNEFPEAKQEVLETFGAIWLFRSYDATCFGQTAPL